MSDSPDQPADVANPARTDPAATGAASDAAADNRPEEAEAKTLRTPAGAPDDGGKKGDGGKKDDRPASGAFANDGEASRAFVVQTDRPRRASEARRTFGPDGSIAEAIQRVRCDVLDRNRRVVLIGGRVGAEETARSFAAELGTGEVLSVQGIRGAGALESWLRDAGRSQLSRAPAPRVLVETTTFSQAAQGLGLAAPFADETGNLDKADELSQLLSAVDARLVIGIAIDGLPLSSAPTSLLPDLYLMPWLGLWLADFEKRTGVPASNLDKALGPELRAAAAIGRPEEGDRELELFQRLRELDATCAGFNFSDSVDAIRQILVRVHDRQDSPRSLGRARIRGLMSTLDGGPLAPTGYDEAPAGERGGNLITRTLFPVAVLTPGCTFAAVRRLVSRLLPEEPMPRELLPRLDRAAWQLAYDDARRLELPHPDLPTWRSAFDRHADEWLDRCHLRRRDHTIETTSEFGRDDPIGVLRTDWHGLLDDLLERIAAAGLYRDADGETRAALVVLHLMLADILGRGQPDEILSTIAGLPAGVGDFKVAGRLPNLLARVRDADAGLPDDPTLADLATASDRLRALAAASGHASLEALSETVDDQVMKLRHFDARRLVATLATIGEVAGGRAHLADLPERIFSRLAERFSAESALLIAAYAVLDGGGVGCDVIGAVTREVAGSVRRAALPDVARYLRELWTELLDVADAAAAGGTTAAKLPAVDGWIDGLRKAADLPAFAALATVAEDTVTTYNISHNYRLEEDRRRPPAIALRQLTLPPGGEAPLIARMLARRPADWIADLLRHESDMTAGGIVRFSAEAQLTTRMQDVVAVLMGGLDAASRAWLDRSGRRELLSAAALRHLGEDGRLPVFPSAQAAARQILAAASRPAGQQAGPTIEALALYPAALLAEWRFRLFGAGDLAPDTIGAFLAVAGSIRTAVAAAGRSEAVAAAFSTLAAAELALARRFAIERLETTAGRFRAKAAVLAKLAVLFRPATGRDLVAPVGTDPSPGRLS